MTIRSISVRLFLLFSLCCVLSVGYASAQSFSISAGITSLTIHPGDTNVTLPVSLSSGDGYSGPVMVTLTGLPSGISVTPAVLSPGSSGNLLLSASVAADQEAFPATDPLNPDAATSTVTVLAYTAAQSASASLSLTVSLENPSFMPSTVNLPIVRIDTGGVPILDKTINVPGTVTITSADGLTSYLPGTAGTDNTATFEIHGNSTAEQPKKPYNLKLNTSTDLLTSMGLVCPYVTSGGKPVCDKSKSYVLLANYDDKTMLRDWAASALANAIPIGGNFLNQTANSPTPSGTTQLMPWASHSLFVEVYLNGEYEGTYQLIEEVKIDSHRVNVTEIAETSTSGSALTGGYLMEIDQRQAEDYYFVTPQGVYIGLLDPDYSPEVPTQTSYITNYVETAEAALFSSSYTDPTLGWRAYFDEASAMNFYIVNDLMGNEDGSRFYSSDYLYKDKSNPLLYMGPVWDFDVSSGNVNYSQIIDPTISWTLSQNPWYSRLSTDPAFMADATLQWNALKNNGILSSWLASIDAEAATLQQAQQNNFGRWPMQGIYVWPNAEAAGSYSGELAYFKNWVTLRMGYMDWVLNNLPSTRISLIPPSVTPRAGTPATMTATVQGSNPTGIVTFSYNSIILGQAAVDVTGKATLTTNNLVPGTWVLEAYYNGDSHNGISGVGVVISVLAPLTYTTTDITASAYTAVYGSSITLNSAVEPTSGTAASGGTMSFVANNNSLGSSPVSSLGLATFSTSTLETGSNVLQVAYSGDATHMASTSNSINVEVSAASANVSLGGLSAMYDGSAHAATVTTVPAGLTVATTYNGVATVPAAAGSYAVVATVADPNYSGTANGTLIISQATSTVTLAGLSATYDGNPHAAIATTTPTGLSVNLTYNSSATVPAAAGSYAVVATVNDPNYTGTASGTLIIGKAVSTVTLAGLSVTYDGNPHAAMATTTPTGLSVSLTYNGSATAPISAGSYAVVATVNDPNYTGTASGTLVIGKAVATASLGNLSATYDGSAHAATVTTVPAGLAVVTTYNGSATIPISAGSYAVVATVNDPNYTGTASGTLLIGKAVSTVTLAGLSVTYDGNPHAATVTTVPNGLTVSFTYSGSATVPTTAGSYAVVATVNDPNYTGTANGTLIIGKAASTVTLAGLSVTYDGNPHAAMATTTPTGLSINLTYNGSATAPTAAGSYPVVATVNDPNYTGTGNGTLLIGKATSPITFAGLSATYDGGIHIVAATTTPLGLAVSLTYAGSPEAPSAAGNYAVTAIVIDPNYTGTATGALVIAKGSSTITLGGLTATYTGNPQTATATAVPLGLLVGITYNGSSTAPASAGSYSVVATVNDPNYMGTASAAMTIGKALPVVAWTIPAAITYGTTLSGVQLDATKSVSGTLSYMPAPGSILTAGTQTLSVSLSPDDATDYSSVTQTTQLVVRQQAVVLSLTSSSAISVPHQSVTFTATVSPVSSGSPSGNVIFYDGAVVLSTIPLLSGSAMYNTTALQPGAHAITAVYSGDVNYLASQTSGAVTVSVAALDFTFSATGTTAQTVSTGGTASYTFAISPLYQDYPGAITTTVSGLPSGATYTLSPQLLNSAGGSQTLTLTIQLPQTAARIQRDGTRKWNETWALTLLLPAFIWRSRRRRISAIMPCLLMSALAFMLVGFVGCGSGVPSPSDYPVTLTATSGTVQHTSTVTLIVQ